MKTYFSSGAGAVRWQQRGTEQVSQAMRYLQRLLTPDRQLMAPALIPIRIMQPSVARLPQRRARRG